MIDGCDGRLEGYGNDSGFHDCSRTPSWSCKLPYQLSLLFCAALKGMIGQARRISWGLSVFDFLG